MKKNNNKEILIWKGKRKYQKGGLGGIEFEVGEE